MDLTFVLKIPQPEFILRLNYLSHAGNVDAASMRNEPVQKVAVGAEFQDQCQAIFLECCMANHAEYMAMHAQVFHKVDFALQLLPNTRCRYLPAGSLKRRFTYLASSDVSFASFTATSSFSSTSRPL